MTVAGRTRREIRDQDVVCMLILISTGEKPNRAMVQMVWYYLIGLVGKWGSLPRSRAFIDALVGRGCPCPRAA